MSSNKNLLRLNKLHRTRENSNFIFYYENLFSYFHIGLTDVVRVTDENIPKYRQVNYDAMREIINERKLFGKQALERGIRNYFLIIPLIFLF